MRRNCTGNRFRRPGCWNWSTPPDNVGSNRSDSPVFVAVVVAGDDGGGGAGCAGGGEAERD